MPKLYINLKNSYGIGSLEREINFSDDVKNDKSNNVAVIYAPNGTMKTSLTNTIRDLINCCQPKDDYYPERKTTCIIKYGDKDISNSNAFVFDDSDLFDSSKYITDFIANKELKDSYDGIYNALNECIDHFFNKIKVNDKFNNIKDLILNNFCKEKDSVNSGSFLDCIPIISKEINSNKNFPKYNFKYEILFDKEEKVKKFIEANIDSIDIFTNEYNSLISKSNFFSPGKDSFGTGQASQLLRSLQDDRFFKAKHKLSLKNGSEITNSNQFQQLIQDEKNRIFNSKELSEKFDAIDKKLEKNAEFKSFKGWLIENKDLIPKLKYFDEFKREYLLGYIYQYKDDFNEVVKKFEQSKAELIKIIDKANHEFQKWKQVIDLFNHRFFVPFKVKLKNQSDILLKRETAQLEFLYKDENHSKPRSFDSKEQLIKHLSTGEKRAFKILQNIFAINELIEEGKQSLLVFDDIADSFDYKNKYAIVEYLSDIASITLNESKQTKQFCLLILTHNFEFYRTVVSRLRSNLNYFAQKDDNRNITLKDSRFSQDIIQNYLIEKANSISKDDQSLSLTEGIKKHSFGLKSYPLERVACFIALIPFVRNLSEYNFGSNSKQYLQLTACLHIFKDQNKFKDLSFTIKVTDEISFSDIAFIYKNFNCLSCIPTIDTINFREILFRVADFIVQIEAHDETKLENKLVLSMALRLKAEDYMISALNYKNSDLEAIKGNQTAILFSQFKVQFPNNKDLIMTLNNVLMTTSENIHLNNFMFEPIVDLSTKYLIDLYKEVKDLVIPIQQDKTDSANKKRNYL